jgi:hypothetical protein
VALRRWNGSADDECLEALDRRSEAGIRHR